MCIRDRSKTFLTSGGGKIILTDLIGIPYWQGALTLAAMIVVTLVVLERFTHWRDELGNDVDGDVPYSTRRSKAADAVAAE